MGTLAQDLRYGLRQLWRSPGFVAVALLTLALGIGANTVMFSVVNTVLLRPLPYRNPGELLLVQTMDAAQQRPWGTAPPDFYTYRSQNRTLKALAAFHLRPRNLSGGAEPERVIALITSSEFLTVLGVQPAIGRAFLPADEQWGQHRVVLLTDGLWRQRYGADPQIVGRAVPISGEQYTVVGVLPPKFSFLGIASQILIPMSFAPGDNSNTHNNYFLTMIGRVKPGTSPEQSEAEFNLLSEAIIREHPENKGTSVRVTSLRDSFVQGVQRAVWVLMGAVGFVLLIACGNLANLLLARAAGRRREIAVRLALGATRPRLLRQLLTESLLLASLGGALGLVLASWGIEAINLLSTTVLPRAEDIHMDAAVSAFAFGVALITGLLFGLAPAFHILGISLNDALKQGGLAAGGTLRGRMRSAFVVGEVALSMILLIGAGLMVKSMYRLLHVEAGFDPRNVLTAQISIPSSKYVDQNQERRFSNLAYVRGAQFFDEVLERVRAIPGVRAVGAISGLPLMGEIWGKSITFYDRPLPSNVRDLPSIQYRVVAGDYFRTLGIRLVSGRAFTSRDAMQSPKVAIVNRQLVERYWNGQDPLGKIISVNPPASLVPAGTLPPGYAGPEKFTVVGVAEDTHYGSLNAIPPPLVYTPYAQGSEGATTMYLAVKSDGDPLALAGAIRQQVAQVDRDQPVANLQTMETRLGGSVARPRLEATVLGIFAALAMLLAAVGIYGVMSCSVTQNTREIGIRMALGEARGHVLATVLREGLALAALGLGIGLAGALALTRVLRTLLFGVSPTDPMTFAVIAATLAAVALAASYLPARRATRVDPMVALRYE